MGNGLAVITTNVGGIPDLVKDMYNGIVVDANHINMNEALKRMNIGDLLTDSMRKINRNTVQSRYTEKQYLEHMKTVFSKY